MSAPSPQASRQVESAEHDSEHEPVHRMSQVAPPEHETLPLAPRVMSQVEPPPQLMLHESPQVPLHSLFMAQASVQLSPAQSEPSMSQALPTSHAHEVPVQTGGGTGSLPQAATPTTTRARRRWRIWRSRCKPWSRGERARPPRNHSADGGRGVPRLHSVRRGGPGQSAPTWPSAHIAVTVSVVIGA